MKKLHLIFLPAFVLIIFLSWTAKSQTENPTLKLPQANEEKVYRSDEVDSKIKITKKTKPRVKNLVEVCNSLSGLTKLSIVFHKLERITNIEIIESSGCDAWDQAVVEAASKIKFKPAVKNGELVSISLVVEYKFGLSL